MPTGLRAINRADVLYSRRWRNGIRRPFRKRPARLYAEGENFGGRLLVGVGVFVALLYAFFRLLYGTGKQSGRMDGGTT